MKVWFCSPVLFINHGLLLWLCMTTLFCGHHSKSIYIKLKKILNLPYHQSYQTNIVYKTTWLAHELLQWHINYLSVLFQWKIECPLNLLHMPVMLLCTPAVLFGGMVSLTFYILLKFTAVLVVTISVFPGVHNLVFLF